MRIYRLILRGETSDTFTLSLNDMVLAKEDKTACLLIYVNDKAPYWFIKTFGRQNRVIEGRVDAMNKLHLLNDTLFGESEESLSKNVLKQRAIEELLGFIFVKPIDDIIIDLTLARDVLEIVEKAQANKQIPQRDYRVLSNMLKNFMFDDKPVTGTRDLCTKLAWYCRKILIKPICFLGIKSLPLSYRLLPVAQRVLSLLTPPYQIAALDRESKGYQVRFTNSFNAKKTRGLQAHLKKMTEENEKLTQANQQLLERHDEESHTVSELEHERDALKKERGGSIKRKR